jgi:hypothetical protein
MGDAAHDDTDKVTADVEIKQPVWAVYRKKAVQRMRKYVVGEDLTGISVNAQDTPGVGGMIAVNESNPKDMWYVAEDFFNKNYEFVSFCD